MSSRSLHAVWPLPLAALVLLAPNGMNRGGRGVAALVPPETVASIAHKVGPYLGTLVAAKCVEPGGRAITFVDPVFDCHFGASRSDVFVVPEQNLVAGLTPGERASLLKTDTGSPAAGQQCLALGGLIDTIDDEAKRPGPFARREELQAMRRKAVTQQQRLMC